MTELPNEYVAPYSQHSLGLRSAQESDVKSTLMTPLAAALISGIVDGMLELFDTAPITLFVADSAAGAIPGSPRIPWKRYLVAVLISIPLLTICLYWVEVGNAFGFTRIIQRATNSWYQASG